MRSFLVQPIANVALVSISLMTLICMNYYVFNVNLIKFPVVLKKI